MRIKNFQEDVSRFFLVERIKKIFENTCFNYLCHIKMILFGYFVASSVANLLMLTPMLYMFKFSIEFLLVKV